MPTTIKFRRGTTAQNNAFTGAAGEITVDTTLNTLRVHDSSTAGGYELAKADLSNVTSVTGNLIPSVDSTYNLGDSAAKWKDLYLSGSTIYLGTLQLKDEGGALAVYDSTGSGSIDQNVTGNLDVSGNVQIDGTLTVDGVVTFKAGSSGTVALGDSNTDNVSFTADVSSNIIPNTDNANDLGSPSQEWRHLYIGGTANVDNLAADSATITGNLDVQGITTLDSATFNGDVTITGALDVDNITTTGYLRGPSTFTIDPATHGDDTGKVIIAGNLQVDGVTTTVNSTTVTINDKTLVLADSADSATADGAGIIIGNSGAAITYNYNAGSPVFELNRPLGNLYVNPLSQLNTDSLAEGTINKYYSKTYFDSDFSSPYMSGKLDSAVSSRANLVRNMFNVSGDITYDVNTGVFTVDVADAYSTAEFDSDFNLALDGAALGGKGLAYSQDSNTLSIDSAEFTGMFTTDNLNEGATNQYYTTGRVDSDIDARITKVYVDALNIDADTIDGLDASQFLRTDADDTKTGNLRFTGSSILGFGDSGVNGHFLLYHDSATSGAWIKEVGNHKINIMSEKIEIKDLNSAFYMTGASDSAVKLYYNGVETLTTTDSSVNVTGNIRASGADIDGAAYIGGNVTITGNILTATTDQLSEGSSNIYYTTARVDSDFDASIATRTTDNLSEGSTNLYYTSARADSDAKNAVSGGTGITYTASTGVIDITNSGVVAATYGSSTEIPVFSVNAQGQIDSAGVVSVAGVSSTSFDSATGQLTINTADGGSFVQTIADSDFTAKRARESVSVTDAGGDGSLTYNNSTGVFTYTGPSAAEARAHFSGSTGITLTDGAISITNTGVASGTYGSGSQVPVLTVNAQGQIDSIGTLAVAGVSSTAFDSATNKFTISTADGGSFATTFGGFAGITLTDVFVGNVGIYEESHGSISFNKDVFVGDSNVDVLLYSADQSDHEAAIIALGMPNQFYHGIGVKGDAAANDFVLGFQDSATTFKIKKGVKSGVAGAFTLNQGTTMLSMTPAGDVTIHSSQQSNSKTTGALVVAGGIGVSGNLRGQDIFAQGNVQLTGAGNFIGNVTGQVSTLANHTTTGLAEGTNLYYTTARHDSDFDALLATKNTDNLTEGSNQYFTQARARTSISVTDAGGDGSLSYDNGTGVLTYTGPSASEVRAHLSGGTGVTYTSGTGVIAIAQPVGTTDSVEFGGALITGNLTVSGNLNVGGTETITSYTDLRVTEPLIKVADSNVSDTYDLGLVGRYSTDGGATIRRAGFIRDASNGEWYVFAGLRQDGLDSSVPDKTINITDSSVTFPTWNFGKLRGQYLGFDSDFRAFSTNYVEYESDFTAVSAGRYAINTTNGAINVTLPAAPTTGDYVKFIDVGNWTNNSVFLNRNGSTIEGIAENFELDIGQNIVEAIFINSTWQVYSSIGQRGETGPKGDSADVGNFVSPSQAIAFSIALG